MDEYAKKSEHNQAEKQKPRTMSRRKFLKASIALIAGGSLGGTTLLLLSRKKEKDDTYVLSQAQHPPKRNPAFGWYALDNGSVRCYTTVPNEGMQVYQMNPIGGMIWKTCDGKQQIEDIATKVAEKFSLDYQQCLKDTQEFLALLEEQNFIVTTRSVNVIQSVWEKGSG